jgi:hypothetical protein
MPDNYVLDEELNKFLNKIRVKYNIPEFNFWINSSIIATNTSNCPLV